MGWLPLALLAALSEGIRDVLFKRGLRELDEYVVGAVAKGLAFVFLLPALVVGGVPPLAPAFWGALLACGALNVGAFVLYLRALRISELSLTVPLVTLTPLFLLVVAPVVLGELPGPSGLAGIALLVAGAYLLRFDTRRLGPLAPFRALLRERGPRLMLLVAFLYAVTASLDKIGVRHSSPVVWPAAVELFGALALLPAALRRAGGPARLLAIAGRLAPIGALGALAGLFQMSAVRLTLVAYVIALKRLSAAVGVIAGHFLFGERGFRERLAGTLLMVLGVVCIALSGG